MTQNSIVLLLELFLDVCVFLEDLQVFEDESAVMEDADTFFEVQLAVYEARLLHRYR
jgi:hypothetical protein